MLEGSDVTSEARAFESGGELFVDATRLAPLMGISIRPAPDGVTILDRDGVEWRGQVATPRLQSLLRSLDLPTALRFDGGSLLLPVGVVAELAGLQVAFDRKTKTILFRSRLRSKPETKPRPTESGRQAPPPVAAATVPRTGEAPVLHSGDWEFFEMPKPREEIIEQQKRAATRPAANFVPSLPPPRESVRMGFGVAAIQGGDYANEINAFGTIGGVDTQLNSLLT